MIYRKLRKFIRDPKSFFEDAKLKQRRGLSALTPKKINGFAKYTVVSAVYNVGRYLNDYFQSLVDQRLDFRKNIFLVMVDDGSTDDSAAIIKGWQHRYPGNILYLHKENGGQASARNLGIEQANTAWMTFIDPDDFVDIDYFLEVDNFLEKNKKNNIKLVSCSLIFFHEKFNRYSDNHPLRYKFAKGDLICSFDDLGRNIQLSASSSFFKVENFRGGNLKFDQRIKPNFEDGHLIGFYLSELTNGNIGFSAKAKYFYRKREDGNSTLDKSWSSPSRFYDVLRYGYLDLFLRYIDRYSIVPLSIQRTILYDLFWYIKHLQNRPERAAFLSLSQQDQFIELLDELFAHIDTETILSFELAGCWFMHKVGMLNAFKGVEPPFQIAYVEDHDPVKSQILVRYFSGAIDFEAFLIDGQDVVPAFAKTVRHDFLERTFVLERRVWLPIPAGAEHARLRVRIGGYNARLSLNGKQEADGHLIGKICQHFLARGRALKQAPWLLMDRDTQADDNAEHLYRHIRHCHPEQPMAFVLRRESHDWPRLAQDGFNLLAYGSREHEDALRTCGKIISSHADEHVVDYFKDGLLSTKPFVFLQHGIIKDDLSGWLNPKKRIDCFVTTTQPEFESIAGDFSRYKFTRKEVVLSGLPRHDALLAPDVPGERLIVIMPTWRQALAGRQVGASSERELSPEFMSSEYALAWKSVLHNPALRVLSQDTGFKVLFFPHANVQPYLADFAVPPYIEVMTHAEGSMQTLFRRAALMVTDYSSVAFELALLRKAVLYYQFDEAAVFGGEHTYQKGYFDYRADGFGPVVVDELALFAELAHLLTSDARPAPDYLARMEAFFPFRDGGNCERVYRAIKALDEPMPEGFVDTEILLAYAKAASRAEAWNLAESRWRHYLQVAADVGLAERLDAQLNLAIALINSRRLPYAAKCLLEAAASGCQDHGADESFIRRVDSAFIDLYVVLGDWDKVLSLFKKAVGSSDSDAMLVWLRQQRIAGVLELRDRCLLCLAKNDWQQLALMLEEEADSNSMDPELESLLLRAFREVGWSY